MAGKWRAHYLLSVVLCLDSTSVLGLIIGSKSLSLKSATKLSPPDTVCATLARTNLAKPTHYATLRCRKAAFSKQELLNSFGQNASKRLFALSIVFLLWLVLGIPKAAIAATTGSATVAAEQRIWALLLIAAAFGSWSEEHTAIGGLISGCMVTFFTAMALSTVGLLPTVSTTPAYQAVGSAPCLYEGSFAETEPIPFPGRILTPQPPTLERRRQVWSHAAPLAVCALTLALDRDSLAAAAAGSAPMLVAFAVASAGTALGAVAAHALVPLPEAWRFAACFAATYIGGTVNFIATADAVRRRRRRLRRPDP